MYLNKLTVLEVAMPSANLYSCIFWAKPAVPSLVTPHQPSDLSCFTYYLPYKPATGTEHNKIHFERFVTKSLKSSIFRRHLFLHLQNILSRYHEEQGRRFHYCITLPGQGRRADKTPSPRLSSTVSTCRCINVAVRTDSTSSARSRYRHIIYTFTHTIITLWFSHSWACL